MSYRYHKALGGALDTLGWATRGGADCTACGGRRQVLVKGANAGWSLVATWMDSTRIRLDVFVDGAELSQVEVERNPGRGWAKRVANAAATELQELVPAARVAVEDPDPCVVHCADCEQPYWTGARHICPGPDLVSIAPSGAWVPPNDDPVPF